MADPKVSAIIIVYNGAAFLHEAISSVLAQTFADWELIIVDDGSIDESAAIAEAFIAAGSGQVTLLRHPDCGNHGMSAARNLGLAHAQGEFVGFLDADDVWLPDKLGEQLTILEEDVSLGMVYGRTTIWSSWLSPDYDIRKDFHYDLGVAPDQAYDPPFLFENLLRNVYQTPTTCNALMRLSVVVAVRGFEEAFKGMFEDQVFFAKMMLHASVFVSNQVWAKYRQHPESASALSAAAGTDQAARLRFLRWVVRYLSGRRHIGPRTRMKLWHTLMNAHWDVVRIRASRWFGRDAG